MLSFCQDWPAKHVSLQRKCNNLKEHLQYNPSHSSGGVYYHPQNMLFQGVVELVQMPGLAGHFFQMESVLIEKNHGRNGYESVVESMVFFRGDSF